MGIARLFFKRFCLSCKRSDTNQKAACSHRPPRSVLGAEARRLAMNPLNTVKGAITTGVVLALLLSFAVSPTLFNEFQLARWLHILAGVMWIGLLYYFNV